VALVGGGSYPQQGEISLAHHEVLFQDKLPEFKRTILELMRQPLENRCITISRSKFLIEYPASLRAKDLHLKNQYFHPSNILGKLDGWTVLFNCFYAEAFFTNAKTLVK